MVLLNHVSKYGSFLTSATQVFPQALYGLILLLATLVLAYLTKKWSIRALNRFGFKEQLVEWGLSKDIKEARVITDTLGSIFYFIVLALFLPNILSRLNIGGLLTPIMTMFNQFLTFIPQLLMAVTILVIGLYFCRFIHTLVRNLLISLKIDVWIRKLIRSGIADDLPAGGEPHQLAEGLASVVYILAFIPIFIVSLETLEIPAIADPIIDILESVLQAVPHVFVALVLLIVGNYIARLVGDVTERLLQTSGINRYSEYLNFKGDSSVQISQATANVVRGVIWIFFLVEALNSLEMKVLTQIGAGVIDYLPLALSALIILTIGLIGGNIFARFLYHVSGSRIFSEVARYGVIGLAIFMTLDQLKFAPTIVNTGFIIVLSAFAIAFGVAFAIAFGLGGRDFAAKQLEKLNHTLQERKPASKDEDQDLDD